MNTKRDYKSFDILLFLLVAGISLFGLFAVASALKGTAEVTGVRMTMTSQIVFFVTGMMILAAAAFIDYRFICNFYIVFYVINILLLIVVLFVGSEDANAARWIKITGDFGIQPSEFSKIFMIVFLAKFIDKYKEHINNILFLLLIFALTALPIYLIQRQPSLSASLVTGVILIVMLFTGKIRYRYFAIAAAVIIPAAIFFYYDLNRETHIFVHRFMEPYQIKRIVDMFAGNVDTANQYQITQSLYAIGSGQLSGKGFFQNTVYVPYSYNDFIFSIIGAEFGFIGCVAVLALMLLIVMKCLLIAHSSDILYGKLICAGVAGMLAFQTFVNVGVATQLLPVTGMTFPFVSKGGSAMWISFAAIGLVLNVSMTRTKSIFQDF